MQEEMLWASAVCFWSDGERFSLDQFACFSLVDEAVGAEALALWPSEASPASSSAEVAWIKPRAVRQHAMLLFSSISWSLMWRTMEQWYEKQQMPRRKVSGSKDKIISQTEQINRVKKKKEKSLLPLCSMGWRYNFQLWVVSKSTQTMKINTTKVTQNVKKMIQIL